MWLIGLFSIIGGVLGALTAYLLVTFDQKWYKFLTAVIGVGGPSSFMIWLQNYYGANNRIDRQQSTFFFFVFFIIAFVIVFIILVRLIKIDKVDGSDEVGVIRTIDIILGRKDYIEEYYKARKRQIDDKLNIPALEDREKEITVKEKELDDQEKYLTGELLKLRNQSKRKLKFQLPNNKLVVLDEKFLREIPSYLDGFSQCINSIKTFTVAEITEIKDKGKTIGRKEIQSFLMNIALSVLACVFGNSSQVRVHFRVYDPDEDDYKLFVGFEGEKFVKTMTAIPYVDSMIEKSDECHRAIIKSINSMATKYNGNNHNIWEDYMTYAFYNIRFHDRPILSFGISVKSKDRYRDLLYFLNYAKFEDYLRSNINEYNQYTSIATILLPEGDTNE